MSTTVMVENKRSRLCCPRCRLTSMSWERYRHRKTIHRLTCFTLTTSPNFPPPHPRSSTVCVSVSLQQIHANRIQVNHNCPVASAVLQRTRFSACFLRRWLSSYCVSIVRGWITYEHLTAFTPEKKYLFQTIIIIRFICLKKQYHMWTFITDNITGVARL